MATATRKKTITLGDERPSSERPSAAQMYLCTVMLVNLIVDPADIPRGEVENDNGEKVERVFLTKQFVSRVIDGAKQNGLDVPPAVK